MINQVKELHQLSWRGPKSEALYARKEQVLPRAISSLAPFMMKEGRGAIIHDVDGRRYLDLTGGWGCLNVGHSHPKVVQAVQ